MNFRKTIAGLLVLLLTSLRAADAATVILKGSSEPIRGFIVSESDRELVMQVPRSDGGVTERRFAKTDIDLVHRPVSPERLATLHPDRPKEYRDYAEELAEKRIDPEARQLGLRLYVIAAHLDPENLGRSSLLGMTALAESPEEVRRYRALAYLLDPEHDRTILKAASSSGTPADSGDATAKKVDLLAMGAIRGLELLRKGRTQEAGQQFRREGISEVLAPFADTISYSDLLHACRSRVNRGPAASPQLAEKIVRLELQLLGEATPKQSRGPASASWSYVPDDALRQPALPLSIDTITPYDPSLCVFRDGEWVAP